MDALSLALDVLLAALYKVALVRDRVLPVEVAVEAIAHLLFVKLVELR